jgi:hypothetical protein
MSAHIALDDSEEGSGEQHEDGTAAAMIARVQRNYEARTQAQAESTLPRQHALVVLGAAVLLFLLTLSGFILALAEMCTTGDDVVDRAFTVLAVLTGAAAFGSVKLAFYAVYMKHGLSCGMCGGN